MDTALAPADRPRRTLAIGLVVALVAAVVTVAAIVGTPDQAEAADLERFTSCAELDAWGAEAMGLGDVAIAEEDVTASAGAVDELTSGAPTTAAPAADAAGAGTDQAERSAEGADGDATNVVVEGVDELDLVERIEGDTWLATSGARLVLVDLAAAEVLDGRAVPWDAQVTYDREAGVAWVVATAEDGSGVTVDRLAVGDGLTDAGRWTTPGMLVDARRTGDQLHLVATEGFGGPVRPFAEGPVPCDQVLHPAGPSDPSATLLVTLPVTGELRPVRATQVVGSGQLVHVTADAAYLATPQWADDGTTSTTIHRFDLATLTPTGSGRVEGSLLNDFSMSELDGHLRVAITDGAGGMVGRPLPIDGDGTGIVVDDVAPATEPAVGGDDAVSSDGSTASSDGSTSASGGSSSPGSVGSAGSSGAVPPEAVAETVAGEPEPSVPTTSVVEPEPTVPDTTVPDTTVPDTTVPDTTVPSTTVVEPDPVPLPEPTEPLPTEPQPGEARNRVVVLDTEGDLDVVGQTERFGHPGESLFGIRFVGDTAYAVTFLTTDPFYVLDLADPTAPKVVGELELPGFSAYLHPVDDGLVVGFGPGADGMPEAKLFDATDPAAPRLVDTVALGGDTPVTYDHHAFVDLGDGRFAVPVTSWDPMVAGGDVACAPSPDGTEECLVAPTPVRNEVVELAVAGGRLQELDRTAVELAEPASRAIPISGGGWAVLAGQQLALAGGPTLSLA